MGAESGLVREVRGASRVARLAFIGTRGQLLLITRRREVLVADARSAQRTHRIAKRALLAAASTDGRYVATAHPDGRVRVRDLRTGERTRLTPARLITSLAFNPTDAGELAVGVTGPPRPDRGQGVSLVRWRSGDSRYIRAERRYIGSSTGRFRRDGRRLLVTAPGDRPRVYDVGSLDPVRGGAEQLDADVQWLGSRLMSVTGNVVNLRTAGTTTALGGHQYSVRDVAAGPDGTMLATGADDGTARIWDAVTGNQMLELRVATDDAVTQVAFTPSGRFLVTATEDGGLRLWNVATGSRLAGEMTMEASFTADESVLGVDNKGRIVTWNVLDGRRLRTGRRVVSDPWYVRLAPRARKVAFLRFGTRGLVIRSIDGRGAARRFRPAPYAALRRRHARAAARCTAEARRHRRRSGSGEARASVRVAGLRRRDQRRQPQGADRGEAARGLRRREP